MHGAAGNKRAAAAAAAVSFLAERRTVVPRLGDITGRYGQPMAVIRNGEVILVGD
ncbi:hypothetical protein ACFXGA_06110 [Actinosynnema sp. NPDC059335]|uniref:hypothetical protein n=1 Tax=Actinosynnema sp. NPDC059335 TaxID=3346804 RepID=UPI003671E889